MNNTGLIKKMKKDMHMRNFSNYTYDSYLGKTKDIMRYFGDKQLENVTTDELRDFLLNYLKNERRLSDRSINYYNSVIRFIVLLILAGVTITTLTGDNGLLQKATSAKQANEEASALEKIKVEVAGSYGLDGKIDLTQLNANLKRINGLKFKNNILSEENKIEELSAIIELDENIFVINNDGTVTPTKLQTIDTLTKNNYGDYIDLDQSVVGTDDATDDWRILYNDKTNNVIYAILADYLPNNNDAVTESHLNKVGGKKYNVYSLTSRDDLLEKLNNTTAWQTLIPEELRSNCQVKGAITTEKILASYNEKYGTNKDPAVNNYIYFYKDNDSSKGADTLYMPRQGWYEGCSGYWLATLVGNANHVMYVRHEGLLNSDGNLNPNLGIRPVVALPSDIQVVSTTSNGATVWKLAQ